MNIKVYGGGCARCKELAGSVQRVVADLGLEATVEKVTDMGLIAARGIITTPALEIDGKIVATGRIPSENELRTFLGADAASVSGCGCGCGCGCSLKTDAAKPSGWRRLVGWLLLVIAVGGVIAAFTQKSGESSCCAALGVPKSVGESASLAADGAVTHVYYFHGTQRCMTCNKIEALTRRAVEETFKDEIASGKIVLESINLDEPENEHFIRDFALSFKVVVVQKGEKYERLERVWELVRGEETDFKNYIADAVRRNLGESK